MAVVWADNVSTWLHQYSAKDYHLGSGVAAHLRIWYSYKPVYDPTRDQPKTVIDPTGNRSEQYYDAKGNLTRQRTQLNATDWAETQYTYADVSVAGSPTYKGALTQQKSLVSGTSESGTWAITDISGYQRAGRPTTSISRRGGLERRAAPRRISPHPDLRRLRQRPYQDRHRRHGGADQHLRPRRSGAYEHRSRLHGRDWHGSGDHARRLRRLGARDRELQDLYGRARHQGELDARPPTT